VAVEHWEDASGYNGTEHPDRRETEMTSALNKRKLPWRILYNGK